MCGVKFRAKWREKGFLHSNNCGRWVMWVFLGMWTPKCWAWQKKSNTSHILLYVYLYFVDLEAMLLTISQIDIWLVFELFILLLKNMEVILSNRSIYDYLTLWFLLLALAMINLEVALESNFVVFLISDFMLLAFPDLSIGCLTGLFSSIQKVRNTQIFGVEFMHSFFPNSNTKKNQIFLAK